MKEVLLQKIENQTAVVGVIGLGYVGLPLIKRLSEVGFNTIGFDIDSRKIDALTNGFAYIKHIAVGDIKQAISEKRCKVTGEFCAAKDADILHCCPVNTKETGLIFSQFDKIRLAINR